MGLLLASAPVRADAELDALVAAAQKRNPQLDALEAQVRALDHKTTQAGAWQSPKLQLSYQNAPVDSFALGVEPMTAIAIGLEQTVPFFGKTGEREQVVRKTSEAKRFELDEKRNELSALVKTAYYRLALARQLRKLTEEHVKLVDQLISVVRAKYEVGRAEQQNLLRLEVLRDRLKDDIEDFGRQDRALTAAINGTLDRAIDTQVSTPDVTSVQPPAQSLDALEKEALTTRPVLKQLHATAQMHLAAADLAEREAVPDPTFFAAYAIRTELPGGNPGRDLVTIGVRVPLPVFYGSTYGAQASESRQQASAVEASRRNTIDAIAAGLGDALATWRRASEKVATYRDHLVPEAHATLDATLASYQVDRADFVSLYDAELELLTFEKTIRMAVADGLIARATVEQLIGRTLP